MENAVRMTPFDVGKSIRGNSLRVATSCKAGKMVPIGFVPMLREDRIARGQITVGIDMMETAEVLMNGVQATVSAWYVPKLAFERFIDLGQYNRSYAKKPEANGSVIPFFTSHAYSSQALYTTLGLHAAPNAQVSTDLVESYNALVNARYRHRSTKLTERTALDGTLAPCLWNNGTLGHIVPDFDQAAIDGELDLTITAGNLPVKGIGIDGNPSNPSGPFTVREAGNTGTSTFQQAWYVNQYNGNTSIHVDAESGFPAIFAELSNQNIALSLSNIEAAKKTAAWAKVREKYQGLLPDGDDDYIIDLLLAGIRMPETEWAQPRLLDRKTRLFGYNTRYAMDSGNLDKSATTGGVAVTLNVRTPQMNVDGYVFIVAEIVPEQLHERRMDPVLFLSDPDELPQTVRDEMDPDKVAIVQNKEVDVRHSNPNGTFGYAGLNWQWKRDLVNVGGKYFRTYGDPFDEDRQRIWAIETTNPALTEDFYLASNIHHKVFADQNADAFEITARGDFQIVGRTVFGKDLRENTGDYQAIQDQTDFTPVAQ